MDTTIFGLQRSTFHLMILIILLVILGIVSFNAYGYISAKDKIDIGVGSGVGFQWPYGRVMDYKRE